MEVDATPAVSRSQTSSSSRLMTPIRIPIESASQLAAEHLERLEEQVRQTGDSETSATQVYERTIASIAEVTGLEVGLHLVTDTGARQLVESRQVVESQILNDSQPRNEVSAKLDSNPRLASYLVWANCEIVMARVPSVDQAVEPSEPAWRMPFLEAMLECCAIAYLKDHYASSKTASIEPTQLNSLPQVSRSKKWATIFVLLFAAMWIPVPFRIAVEGRVMPTDIVGVFAPAAGLLADIHVVDAQDVEAGEPLASIHSPEIELQRERLRGDLTSTKVELSSLRLNHSIGGPRSQRRESPDFGLSSSAQTSVLRTKIRGLEKQLGLIDQIYESLTVRADRPGRVFIRDAQAELVGQTVMQSQALMQIVGESTAYEANIDVPSHLYGYLVPQNQNRSEEGNSSRTQDPRGTASLRLRSNPSQRLSGVITEIGSTVFYDQASVYDQSGTGVIPVTVSLNLDDQSTTDDLVSVASGPNVGVPIVGAPVVGHLSLGNRRLGFILFRPVIELYRSWGW